MAGLACIRSSPDPSLFFCFAEVGLACETKLNYYATSHVSSMLGEAQEPILTSQMAIHVQVCQQCIVRGGSLQMAPKCERVGSAADHITHVRPPLE